MILSTPVALSIRRGHCFCAGPKKGCEKDVGEENDSKSKPGMGVFCVDIASCTL